MDIVYWYYLGSDDNGKVVKRLNDIIEKIELFNYSKEGKYEIFIDAMFGIERFKKTINKNVIRNWLKLSFSDEKIVNCSMFKRFRKRLYNLDDFLLFKRYHKDYNENKWHEYDIDEMLEDNEKN